jgi:ABC-type transport system substrate-binding protein
MRGRSHPAFFVSLAALVVVVAAACASPDPTPATGGTARILVGAPTTLDPARAGDASSSSVIAQLYETLTTFDEARQLQPALAASWQIAPDARRITFRLRPDLAFSDGSPLRASDVVRSWLRLLDPAAPSPLVNLILDVEGASAYLGGTGLADQVGLHADDGAGSVTVDLTRPSAEFVDVVSSPTFAIVPPDLQPSAGGAAGSGFVASGGYRLTDESATELTLTANPRYWAGEPAVRTITLITDLAGASPVEAFEDGRLDYASIGGADASWIGYDEALGPRLRSVASLATDYFGFDTSRPPFDDVRVRQAFAAAVDWRRIARLGNDDPAAVATSMVPPGIPGRSDRDVVPVHDPGAARDRLAAAGYPAGKGFPTVTMLSAGTQYDEAIVRELHDELGITLRAETMEFDDYFTRLDEDPPQLWSLTWVADYPGRNDFLGLLLGTGSVNNYGRWSSAAFDEAIADAGAATDPGAEAAAYDRAESIVQTDAPVIPVSYGTGWALARDGLLGAGQNGLGIPRLAGLAWAP